MASFPITSEVLQKLSTPEVVYVAEKILVTLWDIAKFPGKTKCAAYNTLSNLFLKEYIKHPNVTQLVSKLVEREHSHIEFVNRLLNCSRFGCLFRSEHRHDHTKDEFYVFVTWATFDMKGKWSDDMTKLTQKTFDLTVAYHYQQEPHHPEWEKYHPGKECTPINIVEMAADRVSRNVQFNNGNVNKDQLLAVYLPKFFNGTEEKKDLKLKMYLEYVGVFIKVVPHIYKP